jgi:putative selenium metabolism hydrolase
MELRLSTSGVSAHASAPDRGRNAITAMAPVIASVDELNGRLRDDPFLGAGTIAVTAISAETASLCAIPGRCTIHLDRRLTTGETRESALAELRALPGVHPDDVQIAEYHERAYTGVPVEAEKTFPTWALAPEHPLVASGLKAVETALGRSNEAGAWTFSTNGVASAGRLGIPTIGIGPSDERWAHSVLDQCAVDDLVGAVAVYSALPALIRG